MAIRHETDEGLEGKVGIWRRVTGRGKTLKESVARENSSTSEASEKLRMVEKWVQGQGRGTVWLERWQLPVARGPC